MNVTISEIGSRFLAWVKTHRTPGTYGYYKHHIDTFVEKFADTSITDLRAHHLLEWGTSWHRVQAIQRLFKWAVDEAELLTVNPFSKVKKPRVGRRRRTMTRTECLRLLRKANVQFRALQLCMRESICRPGEARAVQWTQIVRDDESITLDASLRAGQAAFVLDDHKTVETGGGDGAPRVIIINKRLGRLLARLARMSPNLKGYVFLNTRGEAWTRNAARLAMRAACEEAGFDEDFRGERIVAYTFRHSMASAAARVGIRDKMLSELMGHTTTRCTQRYMHLAYDHLRDGMLQIEGGRKARKLI